MTIEYKRLAASAPANTTEAELYAVPTSAEIIANLVITNITAVLSTFRVAHTDASGAAAAEDWLAYDENLAGTSRITIPITAKNPETIRIKTGTADALTFHLSGMLKT
jgi:hypothetical protein